MRGGKEFLGALRGFGAIGLSLKHNPHATETAGKRIASFIDSGGEAISREKTAPAAQKFPAPRRSFRLTKIFFQIRKKVY